MNVKPLSKPSRLRLAARAAGRKFARGMRERNLLTSLRKGLTLALTGQWRALRQKLLRELCPEAGQPSSEDLYAIWRDRHAISEPDRQDMRRRAAAWADPPKFSVVVPVYNVQEQYLREMIESVLRQTYPHWELCIADDCSTKPHVRKVLEEYASRDPRIRVAFRPTNGGISAASNTALELATGRYIALLDHDDTLAEHALFCMAEAILADSSVDMLYSDEDKLDPEGRHCSPSFKPDWCPEYFLAVMYTCHLGVYRTTLVRKIGGFRSEYDEAQDYDLVLRVVAQTRNIRHVPDVLYHWRMLPSSAALSLSAKPRGPDAARRAIQSYLDATGKNAVVEPGPVPSSQRVRFRIVGHPKVSIVIPSACRPARIRGRDTYFLLQCLRSIRRKSTYGNYEVIVVDNGDMPEDLQREIRAFDVTRISFTEPFHLSRKLNLGASCARGEQLLLLNDDTEVITGDWIESMLEFSQQPEIGAVGCKLLFPDGRLQHVGGLLLAPGPMHAFYAFPGDHPGYANSTLVHRNWSIVTGACLMTRGEVYRAVGGFSDELPFNFNDVDYCLKVADQGLRVVYTPYAQLYHHEGATKTGIHPCELDALRAKWGKRAAQDPCYNPNLTQMCCDLRIGSGDPGPAGPGA